MERISPELKKEFEKIIYNSDGKANVEVLMFVLPELTDDQVKKALNTLSEEEKTVITIEALRTCRKRDRSYKKLADGKYGVSSEQLSLFDDSDQDVRNYFFNVEVPEEEMIVVKEHKRRKRRRNGSCTLKVNKERLEHDTVDHWPDGVDHNDPNWVEIGTEVKEELTVTKEIRVTQHILHYGKMKNQPEVADQSPILRAHYAKLAEGTLLSPSLASDMMFMRYRMVQPVTKVMFYYRDMNLDVSEQTWRNWYSTLIWDLLSILYDYILKTARNLHYILIDETFLKVMESIRKGLGKRDNIVGIVSAKHEETQLVLFAYSENKKDGFLVPILGEYFHGHMMSDGLIGYELYLADSKGNCLLHARRKFVAIFKERKKLCDEYEALETDEERRAWASNPLNRGTFLVIRILYCFSEIYYLEENVDDLETIAKIRQDLSTKYFEQFMLDCEEIIMSSQKGSELYQAADYALERREELGYFLTDPKAPKDNNRVFYRQI